MFGAWPGLTRVRVLAIVLNLGLVFFSSTKLAADLCEDAYRFYRPLFLAHTNLSILHLLADKSIHFSLFFSLGVLLYMAAGGTDVRRVLSVFAICLIVGSLSEVLQGFFPGRDPSVADTILNTASGTLAASLVGRTPLLIP